MTKIKIASNVREIEGRIEKGRVTPFGTSAHIPFSKKYLGKEVYVIVPEEPNYSWILSKDELERFAKIAVACVEEEGGQLAHYRLQCIDSIKKGKFDMGDLCKIVEILKKYGKCNDLVSKLKRSYPLD